MRSAQSPPLPSAVASVHIAPPVDIIPQRSPTRPRPISVAFSDFSISDPTSPDDECEREACFARRDSATARYYAQFHTGSWNKGPAIPQRPYLNRTSTGPDSSNLPSLIHSPSSSVSTVASFASTHPLPSRRNKSYSASSTQSADLVTPCIDAASSSPARSMDDASYKSTASTLTSFHAAEALDVSYERRCAPRRGSEAYGSLKQLFHHDSMRAPPIQTSQIGRLG